MSRSLKSIGPPITLRSQSSGDAHQALENPGQYQQCSENFRAGQWNHHRRGHHARRRGSWHGKNLSAASASIEKTVSESSDGVVDFARTTLPEISQMVFELRVASENLRRMSEALERDPSLLMYGAPEPDPGPGV
jgi:hypothetical protein